MAEVIDNVKKPEVALLPKHTKQLRQTLLAIHHAPQAPAPPAQAPRTIPVPVRPLATDPTAESLTAKIEELASGISVDEIDLKAATGIRAEDPFIALIPVSMKMSSTFVLYPPISISTPHTPTSLRDSWLILTPPVNFLPFKWIESFDFPGRVFYTDIDSMFLVRVFCKLAEHECWT